MPALTDNDLQVLSMADALAAAEATTTLNLALTLRNRAHNDGGLTNTEWAMIHVLAGRVIKGLDGLTGYTRTTT